MSTIAPAGGSTKIYKTWEDGFLVRSMTKADAQLAQTWFSGIGPTSCDLEVALEVSEGGEGFYIGEYKGQNVASTIRIAVAGDLYYGSYYYVKEEHRGKGFGRRIRDEIARQIVGDNLLVIDAHDYLLEMNKRYGYSEGFIVERSMGSVPSFWDTSIVVNAREVTGEEINKLLLYDDRCFVQAESSQRKALLEGWLGIKGSLCVVAQNATGEFIGYGCRRPAFQSGCHLIGPLYGDTYEAAYSIVRKLCESISGQSITLAYCKPNADALRLVATLGLKVDFTMVRMYMNKDLPPINRKVFGLTSIDVCGF